MRILMAFCLALSLVAQTGIMRVQRRTAAAPSGSASDDFTGAAGELSANWANTLSRNIVRDGSGYAHTSTAWYGGLARYMGTSWTDNQYAEIVIGTAAANDPIAPMVHVGATGSGYSLDWATGAGGVQLARYDDGTRAAVLTGVVGCSATTVATGDTLRLAVSGTVLTAYKNGSAISGCTYDFGIDTTKYTTGFPGMFISRGVGADPTIDSFAAGNL